MERRTNLKPCPFCGGNAWSTPNYKTHSKKVRFVVKCTKCNAIMEYRSEKAAKEAWNRRVEDNLIDRQKAEIERLKRYDEERDIRLHARLTETARVEAIKEFAERLKQTRVDLDGIGMVAVGNIDAIAEQMTEE